MTAIPARAAGPAVSRGAPVGARAAVVAARPTAAVRGKPGCTGHNEDDDPGGKGPNKNDEEITKPGCK